VLPALRKNGFYLMPCLESTSTERLFVDMVKKLEARIAELEEKRELSKSIKVAIPLQMPSQTAFSDSLRAKAIIAAMEKPSDITWGSFYNKTASELSVYPGTIKWWLHEGLPGFVPDIPEGMGVMHIKLGDADFKVASVSFQQSIVQWVADQLIQNPRVNMSALYREVVAISEEHNIAIGCFPSFMRFAKRIRNILLETETGAPLEAETGIRICG
jgi:hypothetical protein